MDILSALRKVTASIKTWADSKLETKLDKNLGTDNVGKVLTIGDDGNIKSQMLDTGIIVLSGTNDNPINIDEIKVSGTYLIKGVVTTSMDTTSGSDSAKLNKTFIDGFARGELMSIYSLQDGFVNQLMMNPTRPLVRLDSGEGYSDAIDASYVQPVEKTTEMTQPVGIHSDGQLFTEPFNQVQSDWNENDETNPAYIKNRTHYDSRERFEIPSSGENVDCSGFIKISDEVMTLDKLEMSRIEMSLSVNSINFNNAIFYYDGYINPSESVLGVYYHNEDVHMDLVIMVFSTTQADGSTPGMYLSIDENGTGTYSMKLYGEVGELKTLDPKYIKDMYYAEDGEIEAYPETELTTETYNTIDTSYIINFVDKTLYHRFDGVVYKCTVTGIQGQYDVVSEDGTELPFEIRFNPSSTSTQCYIKSSAPFPHTIKAFSIGEIIHPIDIKYLPDEIYTTIDAEKMDKFNPTGTGSFSLNRKAGTTIGDKSFAEGLYATASGAGSHAEGYLTTASGNYSHAEGNNTTASAMYSHAEGYYTKASSNSQHTQGKFNIEDSSDTYADIIGNGTGDSARSNAATVDWSGNAWYAGDVYVGSTSGTNKDEGSKKLATEEYVNSAVPEIPKALPNPYALTFTGAVTGSYDGSEAVSVEIPRDGYIKPDSGIPKSDLSNDVQTSLSKADTALQKHQDISGKQDAITETNKLPYSLLSDTPTIPASASDLGIIEYTTTEIDELWDSI